MDDLEAIWSASVCRKGGGFGGGKCQPRNWRASCGGGMLDIAFDDPVGKIANASCLAGSSSIRCAWTYTFCEDTRAT
jgi:hypothetical protein